MARYTIIVEDQANGGVAILIPGETKQKMLEFAGNLEKASPAFHYLLAGYNAMRDRSKGITREDEARDRRGISPIIIPGRD